MDLSQCTFVKDKEELRKLLGEVNPRAIAKERDRLHPLDKDWIAASPFLLMATTNAEGHCDVSPKGDPAGAVLVLNDKILVIPERPGNRRADGFHNIIEMPQVGLMFIIPGRGETLRINGQARVLRDAPFFDDLIVKNHRPSLALMVEVKQVFYHCSKAFLRSDLWKPQTWKPNAVPSRAVFAGQMERSDQSAEELQAHYSRTQNKASLY